MTEYTKYSLQRLDEWLHDTLNNDDIPVNEIHSQLVSTIQEQLDYHTNRVNRCNELLSLMDTSVSANESSSFNGEWNYQIPVTSNSFYSEDIWYTNSDEEIRKWYDDHVMPSATQRDIDHEAETIQDKKYVAQYTDEELNAMCDSASSQEEKDICLEYNLRETEYLKEQEVKKWILPVEVSHENGFEDLIIVLPEELLQMKNWKEGDLLEWVPNDDLSYTLRKV